MATTSERPVAHFLHIGKTGGSALKDVFQRYGGQATHYRIDTHRHAVGLADIAVGESVFFFLRDPISRFVSGFYSRQRKGQPRYYFEWSDFERRVFTTFDTPDALGRALAEPGHRHHELAREAISRGQHLNHYSDWYTDIKTFLDRESDILHVGFQETLEADFRRLKHLLGLPEQARLPTDPVAAHVNPEGLDKTLSSPAQEALSEWYKPDLAFVDLCREMMAHREQRKAVPA